MQFGHTFQYLFADHEGKNIYQDHIDFQPSIFNFIKHKLHLLPASYTKEEVEAGEQIVLSGAMKSIDALIKEEKKATQDLKVISKTVNILKKDKRCQWMALAEGYKCINHDVMVEMIDGEIPFHDVKEKGILSPLQFAK